MNTNLKLAKQVLSPLCELKKQEREIVRLDKKIIFNDNDLAILKKVNDSTIQDYIKIIESKDKDSILDFVKKNNIILAKLQDCDSNWQIAIIKVNNDFYLNQNLDCSYGQQSENPRLTRQGLLNSFINFDLQNESLNFDKIIWIQNEILNKTQNLEKFNGNKIQDRGFYDNPKQKESKSKDQDFDNDLSIF